jgi:hypothetical protein
MRSRSLRSIPDDALDATAVLIARELNAFALAFRCADVRAGRHQAELITSALRVGIGIVKARSADSGRRRAQLLSRVLEHSQACEMILLLLRDAQLVANEEAERGFEIIARFERCITASSGPVVAPADAERVPVRGPASDAPAHIAAEPLAAALVPADAPASAPVGGEPPPAEVEDSAGVSAARPDRALAPSGRSGSKVRPAGANGRHPVKPRPPSRQKPPALA